MPSRLSRRPADSMMRRRVSCLCSFAYRAMCVPSRPCHLSTDDITIVLCYYDHNATLSIGADNLEHIPGRRGRKRFRGGSLRRLHLPAVGSAGRFSPCTAEPLPRDHRLVGPRVPGLPRRRARRDRVRQRWDRILQRRAPRLHRRIRRRCHRVHRRARPATVDLLGWSLGGIVAQEVARRRPELVRKLVVAGSAPGGQIPGAPGLSEDVLNIMTKPEADADDLLHLFYPATDAARAAGFEHLAKVSTRLSAGGPAVSEKAAMAQLAAIGQVLSVPFDTVQS